MQELPKSRVAAPHGYAGIAAEHEDPLYGNGRMLNSKLLMPGASALQLETIRSSSPAISTLFIRVSQLDGRE
jgi:hypothetical protein